MMKIYEYPSFEMADQLLTRPVLDRTNLQSTIQSIFEDVGRRGDQALKYYSRMFDGNAPDTFRISKRDINNAGQSVSPELKKAMEVAAKNIKKFHAAQQNAYPKVETLPGIECWTEKRAMDRIGLYIPGGSAPLFSSVLMLGIPAGVAGCKEVVLVTPPGRDGRVPPEILYAAELTGIDEIYCIGGAQAIAALSIGTESIKAVDKIFGPGNQYVTMAKEWAQMQGTAIDMPAGPSEVLVIADTTAKADFIAADLLSQAEHGPDSQVILLTNDPELPEKCLEEIEKQLQVLPRKEIAETALDNSKIILLPSLESCFEWSNKYAPEHLIVASEKANDFRHLIRNAGSVFLGNYSCESAGDYASGTNHTLPTNGFAKQYSGVSVDSFMKKITFQSISKSGLESLAPTIQIMAAAEGLQGHSNAVSIRLQNK